MVGFVNIPVNLIKPVAEDITSPVVNIINSSIDKEIFPDIWRVTRVCRVPKIDNPIIEKDFQPISILPVLSKAPPPPRQILAKVDLLPIDNDSEEKKRVKKYKPYQIPRKLLVTLLLFTKCYSCNA